MQYKEIQAQTLEDARLKIKKEFGDRARIIRTAEVSEGGFLGIGKKKYVKVLISISEDDLLKRYKENMGISQAIKADKKQDQENQPVKKQAPANTQLSNSQDLYSYNLLMEKLNTIERFMQKNETFKQELLPPNITEIRDILKENEFFDDFIDKFIKVIQDELPMSKIDDKFQLHNFAYNYIKNLLADLTDRKVAYEENKKNIIVLVGPTGVGKTTTIAKIAANAIREKKRVELITIDGYRIGAKYQLEKYAELMNVNITAIEDNLELQRLVALTDAELILIDTIGRSQQDEIHLVKMKKMLEMNAAHIQYILTLSATTKPKEVKKIFQNFEIFDYKNVIITKSDESDTVGAILNMLIEKRKGIFYYTDGQRVPNDIEKATIFNMMSKIKGFDASVYLTHAEY